MKVQNNERKLDVALYESLKCCCLTNQVEELRQQLKEPVICCDELSISYANELLTLAAYKPEILSILRDGGLAVDMEWINGFFLIHKPAWDILTEKMQEVRTAMMNIHDIASLRKSAIHQIVLLIIFSCLLMGVSIGISLSEVSLKNPCMLAIEAICGIVPVFIGVPCLIYLLIKGMMSYFKKNLYVLSIETQNNSVPEKLTLTVKNNIFRCGGINLCFWIGIISFLIAFKMGLESLVPCMISSICGLLVIVYLIYLLTVKEEVVCDHYQLLYKKTSWIGTKIWTIPMDSVKFTIKNEEKSNPVASAYGALGYLMGRIIQHAFGVTGSSVTVTSFTDKNVYHIWIFRHEKMSGDEFIVAPVSEEGNQRISKINLVTLFVHTLCVFQKLIKENTIDSV